MRKTLVNAAASTNGNTPATGRQTLMFKQPTSPLVEEVGFRNSRFDRNDVEHQLDKLGHIHLVLEHLLLMQINLNLDNGKKEYL